MLTLSEILARAALVAGFDVRKSEVHGMSQRGGTVVSQVRYGNRVHSPLIPRGTADALISLELLEAVRSLSVLRRGGLVLVNDQRITPAPLGRQTIPYPENPRELCEARVENVVFVPATETARALGNEKVANLIVAGAYATYAREIPLEAWIHTIEEAFRPEYRDLNLHAFRAGQALVGEDVSSAR